MGRVGKRAGGRMALAQQLAACDTCFLLKPVEEYARPDGRWETTCLVGAGGQATCCSHDVVVGMSAWTHQQGAAVCSGCHALPAPPMDAGVPGHCGARGKAGTRSGA